MRTFKIALLGVVLSAQCVAASAQCVATQQLEAANDPRVREASSCLILGGGRDCFDVAQAQIDQPAVSPAPVPAPSSPSSTVVVPVPPPAAATQNTITTTAPVTSATTISVGTLAGNVLTWLASAFGLTLTTMGTLVLKRWFSTLGLQMTQQMSDQLDKTLLNGLNIAAAAGAQALQGKSKVEIQNQVVAGAVAYAQDHRAETIQALGLDPKSGRAVEALNARIATLINDPAAPTPAVLEGPKLSVAAPIQAQPGV